MGTAGETEIVLTFGEDVLQTSWQRPDLRIHGEGHADRMARCGVGILAEDQHLHVRERLPKGTQNELRRRKDMFPCGAALGELVAERLEMSGLAGEGVLPPLFQRGHKFGGKFHSSTVESCARGTHRHAAMPGYSRIGAGPAVG